MPSNQEAPAGLHRAWFALGFIVLVLLASVAVIRPSALAWTGAFTAWPPPFEARVPPGDHLQNAYYLWLWRHALTTLDHLPWLDPFQFAATGHMVRQPAGWPLVLVSLPFDLVFGRVAAYNAVVWASFVGSAGATYLLAREVGASRPAAIVAGFAFVFAPFRLVQGATHANGLLAPLLPLTLFFAERAIRSTGRRARLAGWGCAAAFVSIFASGEFHLAVYGTAMLVGWVALRAPGAPPGLLRRTGFPAVVLVAGSAAVAGLMAAFVVLPSSAAGGRGIEEAAYFGPRVGDWLRRGVDWSLFERYAYPGVAIGAVAAAGAVRLARDRRTRLLGLGLVASLPVIAYLAVAPSLVGWPVLRRVWSAIPLFSFVRVPGRILILQALVLAVLAAFAVQWVRSPKLRTAVAAVLLAAIVMDAPATFRANDAGTDVLASVPAGAPIVHLPPFDPGHFTGAVYSLALTRHPAPLPQGYAAYVTPEAAQAAERLVPLGHPPVDDCAWASVVRDFRLRYAAVHLDLFGAHPLQWDADGRALVGELDRHPAFGLLSAKEDVVVYRIDPGQLRCSP